MAMLASIRAVACIVFQIRMAREFIARDMTPISDGTE